MKCLIVLLSAAVVASAQLVPGHYHPYGPAHALRTQYHTQDELGQYSFGYTGGPSSKHESSAGGITQGAFSYIDAHGLVQSRSYVSDGLGFRVAGTDIPVDANTPLVASHPVAAHPILALARRKRQVFYSHPGALPYTAHAGIPVVAPIHHTLPADTPEVAHAKLAHYAQYNYESIRNSYPIPARKKRSVIAYAGPVVAPSVYHAAPYHAAPVVAAPYHAAPVVAAPYHAAPVVAAPYHAAPAYHYPIAPVSATSQFHSQDELGQYSYGYTSPLSSKVETKSANGVTQGSYSYVDANGIVQSTNYVADPLHGFRAASSNLPLSHHIVA